MPLYKNKLMTYNNLLAINDILKHDAIISYQLKNFIVVLVVANNRSIYFICNDT